MDLPNSKPCINRHWLRVQQRAPSKITKKCRNWKESAKLITIIKSAKNSNIMLVNLYQPGHKQMSCIESIKDNGLKYYWPDQFTNQLRKYFSLVGKNFTEKVNEHVTHCNAKSVFWQPITPTEIDKIISKLPNKKNSGYDHLDNTPWKELKDDILYLLYIIFNK